MCRYMTTTAFSTAIFTLQTVGLAVSDSFDVVLRLEAPALATGLQFVQSVFNPDRETPEKCLFFSTSLSSKLFIEAVLSPLFALAVVVAIALPWHLSEFSCGLRPFFNAKRALVDRVHARLKTKRLVKPWDGGPVVKGTFARVQWRAGTADTSHTQQATRTLSLAQCEQGVWFTVKDIAAGEPTDFEGNDERQLRRLLRGLDIHITGRESKSELLRRLRFHLHCAGLRIELAPT